MGIREKTITRLVTSISKLKQSNRDLLAKDWRLLDSRTKSVFGEVLYNSYTNLLSDITTEEHKSSSVLSEVSSDYQVKFAEYEKLMRKNFILKSKISYLKKADKLQNSHNVQLSKVMNRFLLGVEKSKGKYALKQDDEPAQVDFIIPAVDSKKSKRKGSKKKQKSSEESESSDSE